MQSPIKYLLGATVSLALSHGTMKADLLKRDLNLAVLTSGPV